LNQQIELSIETDKYIGNYLTKDYYNELFEKINMSEGGIETNIGLANAIKLSKIIGSKINIIQKNENNIKFSFEFKSSNLTTTKNNKLKHKITIPKTLNNSPIDLYKDLSKSDNKNNFEKPKLLIVDKDNNYIMSLKLNLNKHYRVYHTSSGTIALDHIKNKMIDFVITDIDTKDIGGFELCTTIRNHPKFKHLPIIISSISNSIDNKIKTYDLSANFYIQKPFHIEELINKIKSIEKNKTSLKSHLSNINSIETIEKTSNKQEVFISEMKEIILENLSNQEFGVISLAQKMKISRTQLYMQCKEITNITPSELITNIKLKHAKIMLNDHKLTISEIAYKLGYNSANYFGKQFKNHFGKTPREYRG
jgi:DNA-binding response OmpR family regulator